MSVSSTFQKLSVGYPRFFRPLYMSSTTDRFSAAIAAFDAYHEEDPNTDTVHGIVYPRELLYAVRMTDRLSQFAPEADEAVKLAARCQHIGRWEIPRETFPMDRKGYLQWRNEEKSRHAAIAEDILRGCGYDEGMIQEVTTLLLKKGLRTNPNTQLLEDVVCLVFVEHYLADFAAKHEEEKVVDIVRKTLRKMSDRGIASLTTLPLNGQVRALLERAMEAE